MKLSRRHFITTSSMATAGYLVPLGFRTSADSSLTHDEIRADEDLLRVHDAIATYGCNIRLKRRGARVRVRAHIQDFDAFRECYVRPALADSPVKVRSGNRLVFSRNGTEFIVDHSA